MSELYVCGQYDRATKSLSKLLFVMPLEEELRQNYREGDIIYIGSRVYKLGERSSTDEVVRYQMEVVKNG